MTTTMEAVRLIGPGVDRVDGPLKVTGTAPYPADFGFPDMAHAALAHATVAAGRIRGIESAAAEAAPGVLAVITHRNAPHLTRGPDTPVWRQPPPPLQDDRILFYGQYVGVVVAETAEQATAAARLIEIDYEPAEPLLDLNDPRAEVVTDPWGMDAHRGDVAAGLASADITVDANYSTPDETNNPMGLFATVAAWDGDSLTVHDSTQWPHGVRAALAVAFGVPESGVRVLAPFVGGGFGAALRVWPHVLLTVLAARTAKRPVKLVLTRPEMFTGVGHRTRTVQHIRLGADRSGHLTVLDHEAKNSIAMEDDNYEPVATDSSWAYACPNVDVRDLQARLNIPYPTSMRAPGQAQGNFALESALDELSYATGVDPLELRLRNYAEIQPQLGLPWSSKALRACFEQGAERFGWHARDPRPRSMHDGSWLVGYGMAGVSFFWFQPPCQARASIRADGTAYVRSSATDIGTGTYTVMTQLSAELLGLRLDQVQFSLGDTDMPEGALEGGSGLTAALGTAVRAACRGVIQACLGTVKDDPGSPLRGCRLDEVTVADGHILHSYDPVRSESYADILARHGLDELTADGDSAPPEPQDVGMAPAGAFAARFVEVRVDPDLGLVRVARVVSAIDAGRILNGKTATSQITGGTVGGIGMALLEETVTDPGTGRITNANFGDYLVPVNADIPDLDVLFVGEPGRFNPIGVKGVGEVGLVGMAAAIANAVFHATGRRIRSLPITVDQLL
ncbi:MAG TPA: xanthine dehydrogenase family protein molybdopterin-binding subunit [Streptosporangiaceae bacterium]|nr:xanthine dehydrogenase family protein molybdopterin-binding subunit [Streptosporangiaceae bacterium]